MVALGIVERAPRSGDVSWVPELRGVDEWALQGNDMRAAIALVDSVFGAVDGMPPGGAVDLSIPVRDHLLAAIYLRTYGPRIEATLSCLSCGSPFDLSFLLADFVAHVGESSREPDSVSVLDEGVRLPTGRDELAVEGLSIDDAEEMLSQRCVARAKGDFDYSEIQEALEACAPLLATEVDGSCPECGETQLLAFDLQDYLLTSLLQERSLLVWEVHRVASAYGWCLADVLELSRSDRRALAAHIETDLRRASV